MSLMSPIFRCIYEKLLTSRFSVTPKVNPVTQSGLYAEEENVIRYVSGFIAHKLLQVYKKDHSPRAALYVMPDINGSKWTSITTTTLR